MKHRVLVLAAVAAMGCWTWILAAQDPGDWYGVWQLAYDGPGGSGSAHLVISLMDGKPSIEYLDGFWKTVPLLKLKQRLEGNELSIETPATARKFRVTLTRNGERLTGNWRLLHPQTPIDAKVVGRRVLKMQGWEPLDGIRRHETADHLVDISRLLIDKAPRDSFEQFQSYWEREIKPNFYVCFQEILYESPAQSGEREALTRIFEAVKDPAFQRAAEQVAGVRTKMVAGLKRDAPALYAENMMVSLPALGAFDVSLLHAKGDVALSVGTDRIAKDYTGPRLEWFLMKEQLKLLTLQQFPPNFDQLSFDIIREGVSGYLAVKLGFGSGLREVLGVPESQVERALADIGKYKAKLRTSQRGSRRLLEQAFAGDPLTATQIINLVGYKFGELVTQRFKPEEIFAMGRLRMLELLDSYLKTG